MKHNKRSAQADVQSNKAEPHMEYVTGNYWVCTASWLLANNLHTVWKDDYNNAVEKLTDQQQGKHEGLHQSIKETQLCFLPFGGKYAFLAWKDGY